MRDGTSGAHSSYGMKKMGGPIELTSAEVTPNGVLVRESYPKWPWAFAGGRPLKQEKGP